ncbi:MAG: GAF domain-containing protein [bacterium]
MADVTLDLRAVSKPAAYEQLDAHVRAVLEHTSDPIAAMATMSALIHHAFRHLWTGFYRVVETDVRLRVGPYQGTLGCLEIAFGQGVCGTAAAERRTVIVEDVYAFPGHISCDARSRSEIVVPILNRSGDLVAVLDIDADVPSAFDADDQRGLERIVSWFAEV